MTRVRAPRWRRVFVAACLPYLLLAVCADFLHLHPAFGGTALQFATSERVVAPSHTSKLPDYSCAVCQWLRAGTGLQASATVAPRTVPLSSDVAAGLATAPARPTLLSPDFRGPPLALSA